MTDDDLDVMFCQLDRITKALDRIAATVDRADDEFVSVMPAPGWWAVYDDAGRQSWAPLVGWGVTRSGSVVPLGVDSSGEVEPWNTIANFIRIEGPDDPTAT